MINASPMWEQQRELQQVTLRNPTHGWCEIMSRFVFPYYHPAKWGPPRYTLGNYVFANRLPVLHEFQIELWELHDLL
jgi:hypothetical protein